MFLPVVESKHFHNKFNVSLYFLSLERKTWEWIGKVNILSLVIESEGLWMLPQTNYFLLQKNIASLQYEKFVYPNKKKLSKAKNTKKFIFSWLVNQPVEILNLLDADIKILSILFISPWENEFFASDKNYFYLDTQGFHTKTTIGTLLFCVFVEWLVEKEMSHSFCLKCVRWK